MADRDFPSSEQLRRFPLRAIVAYALRCARRVQPLLRLRPWLDSQEAEAVERALDRVESFCRGEPILAIDLEAAATAARTAASGAETSGNDSSGFAARAAAGALRAVINALAIPEEMACGGDRGDHVVAGGSEPVATRDQLGAGDTDEETSDALATVVAARAAAIRTDEAPYAAVELARVAELAATAAEKAARAVDTDADKFRAADDCQHLQQLGLGSFPLLGAPLDPSERGPLGKLWQGRSPPWFVRQLTLW